MLTYKEALDYIYSFTDYEKQIAYSYAPEHFNLARVEQLLGLLGDPHRRFKSVHIAGTKGKGSTSAMIASILCAAGYRTGLYTSPHLHSFRERILLDGQMIGQAQVAALLEHLKPLVERIEGITTFEIMTALAFTYFAQRGAEFAAIEVGLGGRLDATNVIEPLVSVITSLSYDHTEVLGTTLSEIAREKAGIIKEGIPVVSAPQEPEAMAVIEGVCRERGAELVVVGRDWTCDAREANLEGQSFKVQGPWSEVQGLDLWIPLLGRYQLINATAAVAAIENLREQGIPIPEASVREGLRQVRWPGRLEVLGQEPWVVVDGAHNGDSARKLVAAMMELFHHRRLILVFGALTGHSVPDMLDALLPAADKVILTRANRIRAVATSDLLREVHARRREAEVTERVAEALERALALASPEDLICATGSLSIAAEAREAWLRSHGGEVPEVDPS